MEGSGCNNDMFDFWRLCISLCCCLGNWPVLHKTPNLNSHRPEAAGCFLSMSVVVWCLFFFFWWDSQGIKHSVCCAVGPAHRHPTVNLHRQTQSSFFRAVQLLSSRVYLLMIPLFWQTTNVGICWFYDLLFLSYMKVFGCSCEGPAVQDNLLF